MAGGNKKVTYLNKPATERLKHIDILIPDKNEWNDTEERR